MAIGRHFPNDHHRPPVSPADLAVVGEDRYQVYGDCWDDGRCDILDDMAGPGRADRPTDRRHSDMSSSPCVSGCS
ncbi:unnamed protein product [Soboliphyme baturini]|uniref:Transposase n=1 Tax=Soboliphyme baturini TaxID=241478 RepID=A0A183IF15_9BILA|nr:unnamed protein product [Soboliphyme baturini]